MRPFLSLLTFALLTVASLAENSNPVVLVHGIASGQSFWQYKDVFENSGFPTVAVDVGKFSGSWERACETYAQLVGAVVDYGVCYSADAGRERFGQDYTNDALLPDWGENNKAHMVGHSAGATTIP